MTKQSPVDTQREPQQRYTSVAARIRDLEAEIASLRAAECPTHHRPLVCPSCIGAQGGRTGGRSTSTAKQEAARTNGRKGGATDARALGKRLILLPENSPKHERLEARYLKACEREGLKAIATLVELRDELGLND